MTKVIAEWTQDRYVVTDTGGQGEWYSTDGDNWTDLSGEPVTGERFESVSILLCGGPRDGEEVG